MEAIERGREFKTTVGFSKPVIVLINKGSRSGKELLAYYFKRTGQAILLGEHTAGHVAAGRKNVFLIIPYCTTVYA